MHIIEKIKSLDEEQLVKYTKRRINRLEKRNIPQLIGYDVDLNKKVLDFYNESNCISSQVIYDDYIPLDSKVVYATVYNVKRNTVNNDGKYYYIDENKYIIDCCLFIKRILDSGIIINDEYELCGYIYLFIEEYFGNIESIDREKMLTPILRNEDSYYERINEPTLSWFEKQGNALCSERAVIAQNLMTFFRLKSVLIFGKVQSINESSPHAFNLIEVNNEEKNTILVDYMMSVRMYDINFNIIGKEPYMTTIPKTIDEIIEMLKDEGIDTNEYYVLKFHNKTGFYEMDIPRKYYLKLEKDKTKVFIL